MAKGKSVRADGVSIVLCGQAGMGIQTVEGILTGMLKLAGYNVFATKEYMSRVRGGNNSTEIRVSSRPVSAYVDRIDLLVPLNKGAISHLRDRISADTVVIGEAELLGDEVSGAKLKFVETPFTKIANDLGNKIYSNVVATGTLAGLLGMKLDDICEYVKRSFSTKAADIVSNNVKAAEAGFRLAEDVAARADIKINISPDAGVKDQIIPSGGDAIGLGAMAGGCNFVSSYPMTPSTSVLSFLAKHGRDSGIIVEQAEDEIAAINMAIGAWYSGARAMVTTSGGGFALMVEGVSLAGMLESPWLFILVKDLRLPRDCPLAPSRPISSLRFTRATASFQELFLRRERLSRHFILPPARLILPTNSRCRFLSSATSISLIPITIPPPLMCRRSKSKNTLSKPQPITNATR